MTSVTEDLRLAADFAPATYDDWRKLVEGVLKGAPFEKLVGKTYDGLKIDPIYRARAGRAPIAGRAAAAPWQIMQRIDHPDAARGQCASAARSGKRRHRTDAGIRGRQWRLWLWPGAVGGSHREGSRRRLSSMPASRSNFRSVPQSRMAAIHLAEYIKRKGLDPAACDIRFGLDPLGACAAWGSSPYLWPEIVPAVTGAIKGSRPWGSRDRSRLPMGG